MKKHNIFLFIFCYFFLNISNFSLANEIEIEADLATYHQITQEFTLSGNVKINYGKEYVMANNAVYNKLLDQLVATGKVKYYDKDGNIYDTEKIELSEKFNIGKTSKVKIILKDESIIFAENIQKNNTIKILHKASYTACKETCDKSEPLWKVNASEIVINPQKNSVFYKNAFFKVKNIPVFYTPFFITTITRERTSGILAAKLIKNTTLGTAIRIPIYFNIAPNQDLIVAPVISQNKEPIFHIEYRYLNSFGYLESDFSYQSPEKNEKSKNINGHFFLKAYANINNWHSKTSINLVGEKNYLNKYSFLKEKKSDDILVSRIFLQNKYKNHKLIFRSLYFQNFSEDKNINDGVFVFPAITLQSKNNYKNGMQNSKTLDFAVIQKKKDFSINRTSAKISYEYPFITSMGIKTTSKFILHSDVYLYSKNSKVKTKFFKNHIRVIPELQLEALYPLILGVNNNSIVISPIINSSFKPNTNYNKHVFFEDSQFNEISFNNVFMHNKYSGYDIVESGNRYNYGLKIYSKFLQSKKINFLIGQTNYQEIRNNNKLAKKKLSNIVGRIEVKDNNSSLNYIYTLDNKKLSLLKHSIIYNISYNKYFFDISYNAIHDNIPDASNIVNKKELSFYTTFELYQSLNLKLDMKYDLTSSKYNKNINRKHTNKLTKLGAQFTINHNCAKFDIAAERDYTSIKSKPNNTYWLRIWLKNLV